MRGLAVHGAWCDDHARTICDGVDARGMGHLVWAHAGRKDERGQSFNPIDIADTALVMRGTREWGLRSIIANPEGTARCVGCEADRRGGSGTGSTWIAGCLDAVRRMAVARHLLDRPTGRVLFALN